MLSRNSLVEVTLLAASVFVLGGCETQDYAPIATMQAMPESRLAPFPGATLLHQGSMPRRQSLEEGVTGAYVDREFGTNADLNAVVAYYQSQLGPLGWTGGPAVWQKDGFDFNINVEDPGSLPSSQQGYKLVYKEVLGQDTSVTAPPAT
jgi:hypothetical protein